MHIINERRFHRMRNLEWVGCVKEGENLIEAIRDRNGISWRSFPVSVLVDPRFKFGGAARQAC